MEPPPPHSASQEPKTTSYKDESEDPTHRNVEPQGTNLQAGEMEKLAELVDASLKFSRVLKRKGVSQATLQVAVRCRPLSKAEKAQGARSITRLVDEKVIVVMNPEELDDADKEKDKGFDRFGRKVEKRQSRVGQGPGHSEKRYIFDNAFDGTANNEMLYKATVQPLVQGVVKGINATVFAYGATGSGKTYTMVGADGDPGLMVLSLEDIFMLIREESEKEYEVTCSYVEVYNEVVYDLLQPNSGPLELREDPELVTPRSFQPTAAASLLVALPVSNALSA
ncbi:hypothetical protein CYMTET_10958 [Cymbomonas tetramitiformis]|uniref:Kinesin motor domain-containing protein n=1 Tax=Cymbomonas tetramitiformis TaxID=36881 RepID=A0AAE0GN37_9CHLO|nr:hypothetical protein CYMTET_10958 [Cymbomonas tetramitiformis]